MADFLVRNVADPQDFKGFWPEKDRSLAYPDPAQHRPSISRPARPFIVGDGIEKGRGEIEALSNLNKGGNQKPCEKEKNNATAFTESIANEDTTD